MKAYQLRGKRRREAKVFLRRLVLMSKIAQTPAGRWAWHMTKQRYIAEQMPEPNYPSGGYTPSGDSVDISNTELFSRRSLPNTLA